MDADHTREPGVVALGQRRGLQPVLRHLTEQPELQHMMAKARDLYAWYLALQEAGFNELQAYGLLGALLVTRETRLED